MPVFASATDAGTQTAASWRHRDSFSDAASRRPGTSQAPYGGSGADCTAAAPAAASALRAIRAAKGRSEEHTSELQSLMRISYAVFCLKKKNTQLYII